MKWFKKLIAITLAAVLALAMLTACSGISSMPDKTEEAKQIVDNINAVRTKNGLSALESNTAAMDVANKIAAVKEKKKLLLISEEDCQKKLGELASIQVDGRSRDGDLIVVSHISGEKSLTEKRWQTTYDINNIRRSDCRIVRSANAKYVGVVIKQISNGRYITVVVTY
jgi:hypothetical protein